MASRGWLLTEVDADHDPTLSTPASDTTSWLSGSLVGDDPDLGIDTGFWWGVARVSAMVRVSRQTDMGRTRGLSLAEADLDGDGFSDLLTVRGSEAPVGAGVDHSRLAGRLSVRGQQWGFGLWAAKQRLRTVPTSATFSFPLTTVVATVAGEEATLYDLETGEALAVNEAAARLRQSDLTTRYGADVGVRMGPLGLGLGVGWVQVTETDIANLDATTGVGGDARTALGDRDLERRRDSVWVALRLDGRHDVDGGEGMLLWGVGSELHTARKTRWTGLESLEVRSAGVAGDVLEEWVRAPALTSATEWESLTRVGIGFRERFEDLMVGGGVALTYRLHKQSLTYADALTFRVDDPGVPGERGRTFVSAAGGGDWEFEREAGSLEVRAAAAGAYLLKRRLAVIVGGSVGYRETRDDTRLDLVDVRAISGSEQIEPNVVNPVEIPYANLDATTRDKRTTRATLADIVLGLSASARRLDLVTLFRWDRDDRDLTLVQGVWHW